VRAASSGDFGPLERQLDEDFRGPFGDPRGKREAARRAVEAARRYGLSSAEVTRLEVEVEEGGRARTSLTARLRLRGVKELAPLLLQVEARWVEHPDGWRILEVTRVR
jgi:hypothetical protein